MVVVEIEKVIKQPKFKDGYQKAMINLFYTSNYFRDSHMTLFNKYQIQGQHFNILRILKGKHPEVVSPGYIKDVMLDKGRDITRLIDKLQSLGWVNRHICPENKRKMNINLTEKGLELVDRISNELTTKDMELKKLTEEEYLMLSDLLDKMRG
jgi:DNA-binding MarR family transcriptional regulator